MEIVWKQAPAICKTNILYFGGLNHFIFFKKSDKNYSFSFLVKIRLFPNDLHGNYITCTVECTFHLTIDVHSLKFCEFYFSLCKTMTSYVI